MKADWVEPQKLDRSDRRARLFICWHDPNADFLVESGLYRPGDVILQKLSSMEPADTETDWTDDPVAFFRDWQWPMHRMVEKHLDAGVNIYAFGCRTDANRSPEKKRILDKLGDRYFPIPWGSSLFDWDEIKAAKPVMSGFEAEIGWVGSVWGRTGHGNIETWRDFMEPLSNGIPGKRLIAGKKTKIGPVNDPDHKKILRASKLCPILNAPGWRAEAGVQDRFWTVFTAGRFGVADTEGVLGFFDPGEVVYSEDPAEYLDMSRFFHRNVELQLPFIEKAQARIKAEYNYYHTWSNLLTRVGQQQARRIKLDSIPQPHRRELKIKLEDAPFHMDPAPKLSVPNVQLPEDKTIYLLGGGPAMDRVDLAKLQGKHTIAFDRSIQRFRGWGFDPTYYMCVDPEVLPEVAVDIDGLVKRGDTEHIFLRDLTGYEYFNETNFSTRTDIRPSEKISRFRTFNGPQVFGTPIDPARLIYWGRGELCALQALYMMGYRNVVLMGCDGEVTSPALMPAWQRLAKGIKENTDMEVVSATPDSPLNGVVWDFVSE